MTEVTITVGGRQLSGWEAVSVSKSMDSLCGSFSLTQSANKDAEFPVFLPIFPGDWIDVYLDETALMVGWVDKVSPSIGPSSHTITVEGREITCDLVDCGHLGKAQSWKNVTIAQLARELLAPFNLEFSPDGADGGDPFRGFTAEPGDTVFQTLQKAAALRGLLLVTTRKGKLELARAGSSRTTDQLVYGKNVLLASGGFDNKDRFSSYTIRGTATPTPGAAWEAGVAKMHVDGTAKDPGITRYRPLVAVAGGDITRKAAQAKAAWEATTRAAKAGSVDVVVQGWAQSDGSLWECQQIAPVDIPPILGDICQDLLISKITYTLGPSGTTAAMTLVHPGAYTPEDPKVKKSTVPPDPWADIKKAVQG